MPRWLILFFVLFCMIVRVAAFAAFARGYEAFFLFVYGIHLLSGYFHVALLF